MRIDKIMRKAVCLLLTLAMLCGVCVYATQTQGETMSWEQRLRAKALINGQFPTTKDGLTYGSFDLTVDGKHPDLVPVVATEGSNGYARFEDLNPVVAHSQGNISEEEMKARLAARNESMTNGTYELLLYDLDGNVVGKSTTPFNELIESTSAIDDEGEHELWPIPPQNEEEQKRYELGLPPKYALGFPNATGEKSKLVTESPNVGTGENNEVLHPHTKEEAAALGIPTHGWDMLQAKANKSSSLNDAPSLTNTTLIGTYEGNVWKIKGTPVFDPETNNGGNYFAFSPIYNGVYKSCYAMYSMPYLRNTNSSGTVVLRNAYASLGIYGNDIGVDLGIANWGSGWFPYSHDILGHNFVRYHSEYVVPSGTAYIELSASAISSTSVRLYVNCLDANGDTIGDGFLKTIPITAGALTMASNGLPKCRFYRFSSLIPAENQTNNINDGTYMTDLTVNYCQLISNSGSVNWGITTTKIESVWVDEYSRAFLDFSSQTDWFSVTHSSP